MSELQQVPRVVVICDRVLEHQLIDDFVKLGLKGWTSYYCNGKGAHAIMEDPFEQPERSRVRIEMVTSPRTATAIMTHVESAKYRLRSVFAFTDNVYVSARRNFADEA